MNKMKQEVNKLGVFAIVILTTFCLVLPLVSSVEPSLNFKAGDTIDIKVPCYNNGTYCSASSYCNITLFNPSGNVVINNLQMTNKGSYHNYTIPDSTKWVSGVYLYSVACEDGNYKGAQDFYMQITPTGESNMGVFYFLIIILVYGIVVFGVWKEDITITLLGTFGLYFIGLYILYFGIDIYKNIFTQTFAVITLCVAAYLSFKMAMEYIYDAERS